MKDTKELKKCLKMVKEHVEWIEQRSCECLQDDNIDDDKAYHSVYNINQRCHKIRHILDTYFIP